MPVPVAAWRARRQQRVTVAHVNHANELRCSDEIMEAFAALRSDGKALLNQSVSSCRVSYVKCPEAGARTMLPRASR